MSRAVLVEEPGRHRIVPLEEAELRPGDARVRVAAAGMCGSDREVYAGTRPPPFVRYPVIPGHEWSGTVEAVGAGVSADLVGAPVVGEGFRACFTCESCRSGATNLCQAGYDETGFTKPGAFADHLVLPARLLHVLSDGVDLRAAALLEPAACAADAVRGTAVQPGERAAVVGAGTLGLLAIGLLAAHSPGELLAIDTRPGQDDLALRLGATSFRVLGEPATSASDEQATSAGSRPSGGGVPGSHVGPGGGPGTSGGAEPGGDTALGDSEMIGEGGFDVVIEAAGASTSAQLAAELARRGGRVALIGIPGDDTASLPVGLLVGRQLSVTTVFGASSAGWLAAVRAFNAGLLDPAPLVTHELTLEDYGKAIELLSSGRSDVGKILLRP